MPFRQQLQILLPSLAASLLIAFAFLWLDSRQAGNGALLNRSSATR